MTLALHIRIYNTILEQELHNVFVNSINLSLPTPAGGTTSYTSSDRQRSLLQNAFYGATFGRLRSLCKTRYLCGHVLLKFI